MDVGIEGTKRRNRRVVAIMLGIATTLFVGLMNESTVAAAVCQEECDAARPVCHDGCTYDYVCWVMGEPYCSDCHAVCEAEWNTCANHAVWCNTYYECHWIGFLTLNCYEH